MTGEVRRRHRMGTSTVLPPYVRWTVRIAVFSLLDSAYGFQLSFMPALQIHRSSLRGQGG